MGKRRNLAQLLANFTKAEIIQLSLETRLRPNDKIRGECIHRTLDVRNFDVENILA